MQNDRCHVLCQVARDQIVTEHLATARNRNELVASQANLQMLQVRVPLQGACKKLLKILW